MQFPFDVRDRRKATERLVEGSIHPRQRAKKRKREREREEETLRGTERESNCGEVKE